MSKFLECSNCHKCTTQIEADDRNFNIGKCAYCGYELMQMTTTKGTNDKSKLDIELIKYVEAAKLAGFNSKELVYDDKDGGYSSQTDGYYDTKDAVKDIKKLIKDTCERVIFESFKSSTAQAIGDKAKYWTNEGYYEISAESKYYPQDWYDKSFKPNLDKILKKELGDE